jgi:signal transduction histidine kinase/class 3 adenylate cyclase
MRPKRLPWLQLQLLWLVLLASPFASAEPIELRDGKGTGYRPSFEYLVDEGGEATLPEIEQLPGDAFRTSGPRGITLGFIKGAVWLRFAVLNRSVSDTTWLLQVTDPLLDDIQVYQEIAGGEWRVTRLGDHHPLAPDAVDALTPLMRIMPAPDQVTTYYLRIQSNSSMLVDLRLLTAQQFYKVSMGSFLGYGAMFGIMVAMCLYNLFLFVSLRDTNYLLYVISITSTGLFLASLSGHAPRWLWPDYRPWSEEIFQVIVAVTLVAGLAFCTRFLQARQYAPALHRIIVVLMVLAALTVPLSALTGFQFSIHLTGAVSAAAGTAGLVTAVACLLRGQRSARYYLVAWAGYCIGTVFTAARQHGFVDNSFVAVHGMEMGAVLETVLISFALSDRYNEMKQAKERAQHEVAESLRRMDRLKDEFLANTSHELRTPLQGIIGLAESMLDGAAGRISEAAASNLSMIVNSGQRLASLVNDILDFSKMRTHELVLRKKPVDLRVAVDVVMRLSAPLAEVKSLQLINEVDSTVPSVLADEDRLQQILHNLIGNAVKFTDTGSVRVRAVDEGGRVRVQVIDTGPGIAEGDRERIFESFEQVEESATRVHGGTGLGLAVTRNLVQLHGSNIELESRVGEGSTFSFVLQAAEANRAAEAHPVLKEETEPSWQVAPQTARGAALLGRALPVRATAVAHDDGEPGPAESGDRIRILVVDDEPVNQQVMLNHLSLQHYDVLQAENGMRALELLAGGEKVDLVLLDVMMPKLSGFEVCREIRKTLLPTQLPVVMVTARTQMEDLKLGLQAGANDYITKPVAKGELLARIKTHLNLVRINSAYSHYVPHEFLRYLKRDSIIDVQLGDNVEMEAAVLVSDIRDFTTLSESMTPDENFTFINGYLAIAGPPIRKNGGFIDRYTGDSVMAVFPGGADDALGAARDTMASLAQYNLERDRKGQPRIRIGIGMHLGRLRLGIVGELQRRQGDIFADAVNVATRIEGMTKTFGSSVIVSEAFLANLSDVDRALPRRRSLGRVVVKGRNEAVGLHEAFEFDAPDLAAHKLATRAPFELAQQHYEAGSYSEAIALLGTVLRGHDGDAAARYLLAEATARLREQVLVGQALSP